MNHDAPSWPQYPGVIDTTEMARHRRGPETELCRRLHELTGLHAVVVSSGTAALALALASAGVHRHARVAVPSYSYEATWVAVELIGAQPVMVPVDPATLTCDVQALAAAHCRFALPVELHGRTYSEAELSWLAEKLEAVVVDSAQAGHRLGRYHAEVPENLSFAHSLNRSKIVSGGEGGVVLSSAPRFIHEVRLRARLQRPMRPRCPDFVENEMTTERSLSEAV